MSNNKELVKYDSEILFLYDAKMCNPNGDPDEENKPRMDCETGRNLVSDVRLKRYIRDYFSSKGMEIWVSKLDDKTVDATKRLNALIEKYNKQFNKKITKDKYDDEFLPWLKNELIDVRLFGATIPIKSEEGEKGGSLALTGPVQFSWGYSLNHVVIIPSSSITSHFAGRGEDYGTIGKDWRVYYSLIAFYGIASKKRAEKTNLTEDDLKLLWQALLEAIPSEATTRSKLGQTPRLALKIDYKDGIYVGDLRKYVHFIPNSSDKANAIRDINDYKLDLNRLCKVISSNQNRIANISFWKHEDLNVVGDLSVFESRNH